MMVVPVLVSLGLSALAPATTSAPAHALSGALPVQVVTSEVLSLLYFTRSAAGEARTSDRLKTLFDQHANDDHRAALADFRAALRSVPAGTEFFRDLDDRPRGRSAGVETQAVLETRASFATDLDDFGRRILGLLPVGEHARLLGALQTLRPLHAANVWLPEREALEDNAEALRRRAAEQNVPEQLGAIARFYGARWPLGQPMVMALVPVPAGGRVLHAHSIGAVQVIEVPPDDDPVARLGVIVHEACHSLYRAQPLALQRELSAAFQEHAPGLEGDLLLHQLNEGLATALGNAWTHAQARGAPPDKAWYNDPTVDAVAHALYDEVAARMTTGQTIDAPFIKGAVAALRARLPTPAARPRLLFDAVVLLSDEALDGSALVRVLRQHGGNHSSHRSSPPGTAESVGIYDRVQGATPLLVLTPSSVGQLGALPFASALAAELEGLHPDGAGLARLTDLGDGRRKLVVLVRDQAGAENALAAIAGRQTLPLEAWFRP
jgi:hypothetical protein